MTEPRWFIEAWEIPGASPFQRRVMDVPGTLIFTQPASGVGRANLSIPADWGRLDEILDPDNDVGSLLRVMEKDRAGVPQIRAEYLLRRTETPRRDAGNLIRLTSPSIEDALEWAVVYPHDWPEIPSVDPNWTYGFVSLLNTQNQGFEKIPYSLINPGAEDGTTNGWPTTGTHSDQIAPETFEAIEDAGDADDGDWYFNITADIGEGVFQDWTKPLVEGKTYIVSSRLFVATGETTRMEITPAKSVSVGSLFSGAAYADAVGNDAYQTVTVTFVADAGGAGGISVLSQTDGNTFRLDKVRAEGFGIGTEDWEIRGNVDVFAVVPTTTVPAPPVDSGSHSLAWHPNSGVAGNDTLYLSQATVPGQEVTGEIKVYHTEGANKDLRIVLRIPGVNPNTQNVASEVFSVPTATWTLLTATGIATTTTTELELRYDETGAPANNIYVDTSDFYTGQAPATIGDIMLQLLADAQTDHTGEAGDFARATLLWLKADFTALVDSAGNAWRASESLTIVRGKTYGKVLSDDFAKLGYEYRIKPNPSYPGDSESHILQIFNPANLTTRVGGASNDLVGSIGFSGGNVTKGPVVQTPKSRTVALAEGAEQLFAVAKDAAGVAAWGARELYLAERDVLDATTLAQSAATALTERGAAIQATKITIVDDDEFSPFIDFEPGDWVRGELPPDLPRGNHRIVAITGTIAEGNAVFDLNIGAHVFVGASGMHEAVSRLLSRFDGTEIPVKGAATTTVGVTDTFGGPIEVTYLVAASDARAKIRAVADFVCNSADDQTELGLAVDKLWNNAVGEGGILQLTAGTFSLSDFLNAGAALQSLWLRGAGVGATILNATSGAGTDRDGFIVNNATWATVSDLRVAVPYDGYRSAVALFSVQDFGSVKQVHAYISPDFAESQLIGAFWIDDDTWIEDCVVEAGSEGTGIYVDGDRCHVIDNYIQSATTQGFGFTGDGIYVPSGSDDCHIISNTVKGSITNAGIRIAGDRTIVIGNTCPDGITIDATADGTIIGGNTGPVTDNGTNTVFLDRDDFFNGTFRESQTVTVTEAAGTVTMSLEGPSSTDLTMRFSDGHTTLDTTPALTIALTTGSDISPTPNWIYIPQSTKVLTKDTSDWPSEEHIKVAFFLVPSATFVAAQGAVVHQNWTDHAAGSDDQGHLSHIVEHIRHSPAVWHKGLLGAGTDDYLTITGTTVDLKIASGSVYQLHEHTVAAVDTSAGDVVLVKNWSGDAYHDITNLYDIVKDSANVTIPNNRYFNLVVWGVANLSGTYSPTIINLSAGTYTSQAAAEADLTGYDDFTMPREFVQDSSTGFLICRLTVQKKTATWEYKSTTDLRGTTPQSASGGAAGVTTTFLDNQIKIVNVDDVTSILEFDVSGVTTGTTRTWTVPDLDGTVTVEGVVPVKTDTGDPSSPVEGQIVGNTFDNNAKIYLDGAWRTLLSY